MRGVQRAEAVWLRIIGVLLVLVGLTLLASPLIMYGTREKIIDTPSVHVSAQRHRAVVVPRVVSALIIGAGVLVFVLGSRRSQES
jgi:uncharacterized membrane protein YdcZ (DUF606 family)